MILKFDTLPTASVYKEFRTYDIFLQRTGFRKQIPKNFSVYRNYNI